MASPLTVHGWRPAAAVLALIAVGSPALAQSRDQVQTLSELRILQEQTQRLQVTVNTLADALKALKDQVKDVTTRFDTSDRALAKGFADDATRMGNLTQVVQNLQEKVRDNSENVRQLEQEIGPIRQSLSLLTDAVGQARGGAQPAAAGGTATAPPPATGTAPPQPTAPVTAVPPSPTTLWNDARGYYYSGDHDLAINAFQDFINRFPQDPRICEAQYSIGDSHRSQKKYAEAVQDYLSAIKSASPNGDCVPNVYIKLGDVYQDLKQPDKAKDAYSYVTTHQPENASDAWKSAVMLASDRLKNIK